jgi:hypothetical protein
VAVVVQNLITAHPKDRVEHFPEREIRAAMLALKPQLRPGIALEQYKVDVDCLIERYRPKDYTPRITRYLAPGQPDVIKRPVGRPTHAPEVDRFFRFLQERIGDDMPVSRKALGDEYGVHMRTIATYLDDLKDAGKLTWVRKSRGLVITFTTSDVIEIISAPETAQAIAAPEIEPSTAHHGETEIQGGECVSPDRAEADHTTEPPTLAELAKSYLDQPAREVGERLVNAKTSTITYRRTATHFAQLVTAEYPYTEAQAVAAYRADQALRAIIEADIWQRFFAQLKAMNNDELVAYITGGCRRDVAELSRKGALFDKHLYATRLKCAKQHLGWRGIRMPKRTTRIRSTRPGDAWLPEEIPVVTQLLPLEALPEGLLSIAERAARQEAAHVE